MLISEAHRNFRFSMDKMDSLNYPNFQPEEIDLLLDQAQCRIVKQRYGKNNIKRESFEETEKRTEDLKGVIRTIVTNPSSIPGSFTNSSNNASFFNLTSDHWFLIWEKAYISCPTCNKNIVVNTTDGSTGIISTPITVNGIEVEVRPISHLEYEKIKKDPFKGPDKTKVLRLEFIDSIELIPEEDCQVIKYVYRYIKRPTQVSLPNNIGFDLSEHVHQEIVDQAVLIALEGIEAKRNGTFTPIIDNNNE